MTGSIADNVKTYKKFKFTPPAPSAQLIDCTNFTIDFTDRKFLNVGLDPSNNFDVTVQILTSSRYVNISSDFLAHIFSLMGNLMSFILDQPLKYKRNIYFLETDFVSLSSMVYRGETVLVIESKIQEGCRILLNRANLITLQYLEWTIFESIAKKIKITRSTVLQQFDQISTYFKNNFKRVEDVEEMSTTIKNISDDLISSHIPKTTQSFVSQLKLFATKQLAQQCVMKVEDVTSDVDIGYDYNHSISPSFPPTPQADSIPMNNPTHGNLHEIAVDQNDGPSYFDLQYSEHDSAVSEMYWLPRC